jgi:hypothetical protein
MINVEDFPPLLTVSEVQQLLRIGRGKAYDMIRTKEIPLKKVQGCNPDPARRIAPHAGARSAAGILRSRGEVTLRAPG